MKSFHVDTKPNPLRKAEKNTPKNTLITPSGLYKMHSTHYTPTRARISI